MRSAAGLVLVCGAALWTWPATAAPADVVYVTDELRLGLFSGEETSGRPIKTLTSGARLTVLERSLMSIRVRTEEGDEGWVRTAYVVEGEPARRRVAGLETDLAATTAALAAREAEAEDLTDHLASTRAELDEAERNIAGLPALTAENETLREALESRGIVVPILWFGVALVAALIAGFATGYWWLGRRVRKQFGGIRVY
jgi:hypothetical protein